MRKLLDQDNGELKTILEDLLARDIDVTVREVSRQHSSLKNASAFTRNEARMSLIRSVQQRQADARQVKTRPAQKETVSMAQRLKTSESEASKLQMQVNALIASHVGCVRAITLAGGMQALERFWKEYKAVADTVHALGAVPKIGTVYQLTPSVSEVP